MENRPARRPFSTTSPRCGSEPESIHRCRSSGRPGVTADRKGHVRHRSWMSMPDSFGSLLWSLLQDVDELRERLGGGGEGLDLLV
jgi:hypothetical protein